MVQTPYWREPETVSFEIVLERFPEKCIFSDELFHIKFRIALNVLKECVAEIY